MNEEDAAYEEKIDLVDFDYDYILAAGLLGSNPSSDCDLPDLLKETKGGKQDD